MFSHGHRSRWQILPAVTFLALLSLLTACGGDNSTNTVTPTPTATAIPMVTLDLGIPKAALNSPVVGNLPDNTPLHVTIAFKPNNALLNKLDTQKVQQGKQTDVASLANQLGITNQQYQQIKSYFGVQDATFQLSKLHTNLTIDAKAGPIANLLHTKFVYHQYQNRKFFAPSTSLQLPKSVADYVLSIDGLDSFTQAPQPGIQGADFRPLTTTGKQTARVDCTVPGNPLLPQQIAAAYGYSAFLKQGYTGRGTTVILPELAAFNENDVQMYLSCVDYRGKLSVYNVAPAPDPNANSDGMDEATLDVEMVAGIAPYANIEVYQTDGSTTQLPDGSYRDPMHDVLNQIVENNTNNQSFKVLSSSWGLSEHASTSYWMNTENNDYLYLTRTEHISAFVASGDCGAYEDRQYPGQLAVQFPSSSPYVIGVGGTSLTVNNDGSRASEVVWSSQPQQSTCDNSWGSGGGVSQVFRQPQWQTLVSHNAARQVPDISAVADNIVAYIGGQWVMAGGTSAAAPIWASGWCLLSQMLITKTQVYFYGPGTFYEAAARGRTTRPFFGITQGNNLYYSAHAGYNMADGLGAPNLPGLYNTLYPLTRQ